MYQVDCNLYGMGHMHLLKMKFRHPVPSDLLADNADSSYPEALVCKSSYSQVMLLSYWSMIIVFSNIFNGFYFLVSETVKWGSFFIRQMRRLVHIHFH